MGEDFPKGYNRLKNEYINPNGGYSSKSRFTDQKSIDEYLKTLKQPSIFDKIGNQVSELGKGIKDLLTSTYRATKR